MYRKFTIEDDTGHKIEFECHPDHIQPNFMVVHRDEIAMGLGTRNHMLDMIEIVCKFMSGNTINRIEVEEVEE